MKKFGTPIGAAPGSANENDGFDALGVPMPLPLPLLEPFFFPFLPFELVVLLVVVVVVVVCEPPLPLLPAPECWPCELPGCLCACPLWRGGVCVWLLIVVVDVELDEVEVEVEDDDEEDDDDDDDDEPLPVVVLLGGDVQDCEDETTPAGRLRLESGVPARTPGKVNTWPVINFTVIVHVSARATGINARACTARTVLTVANATLNRENAGTAAMRMP